MTSTAPLLLMTPGPTRVPDRVLKAGGRPMIHHRTPEFSAELSELLELLAPVFGTRQPVLPVHTTGRGALEATICNLFSPGDEVVACCNGQFGEMWARLAESYALIVHKVATDWDASVQPTEVDAMLGAHPRSRAVLLPYGDTSTGVANDVAAVARVAAVRGAMILVDGVSSIGGMPFELDEWGVDVAVTASQKCLMSAPGLAFAVLSDRAWAAVSTSRLTRNYWDYSAIRTEISKPKPETPGTPPVHIVLQLAEALRMVHEEGLDAVHERHEAMARRTREGVAALGLAPQCPNLARYAATLTAIALPADLPPQRLRDGIKARGILTAAGLAKYRPSAFRIGHMGDIRMADVERTLAALREVIAEIRGAAA